MLLKYVTITTAEALYAALGMSIFAAIMAIILTVAAYVHLTKYKKQVDLYDLNLIKEDDLSVIKSLKWYKEQTELIETQRNRIQELEETIDMYMRVNKR